MKEEHAVHFFAPLQDPAIYKWISGGPLSTERELAERWAKHDYNGRLSSDSTEALLHWAVKLTQTGQYLGWVDICVDQKRAATNVGYLFFPAYWGQGYSTEALQATISHLQSQGITPFRATVTQGHTASCRVLEKCGFYRSRLLPDHDTIRGIPVTDVEFVRS